jgi:O-antigen/teichoic acid export membrane protein
MLSRLRPSLVLALSQIVLEGSAFLRNLILARLLGVEQMGLAVALALGIRALEMMGDFGLERLLVQVRSHELSGVRGTVHLVQAAKGLILMGIAVVVAKPLCTAINPALDPYVFVLASAALVLRGFINCEYRERQRVQDFSGMLYAEGISNVIAVVFVAPIALATRDYSALAWASVLQASLLCLLSHLFAKRAMIFAFDRASLRKAFRFLAKFAISAQLSLLPALVGARFLLTLDLPRFSNNSTQPAALRKQYSDRLKQVGLVAVMMTSAFAILGTKAVAWLYGLAFVPLPEMMALLALAAGLRLVRAVPNTLLLSKGKTLMMLICNLPRLLALLVALAFIARGHGLVTNE